MMRKKWLILLGEILRTEKSITAKYNVENAERGKRLAHAGNRVEQHAADLSFLCVYPAGNQQIGYTQNGCSEYLFHISQLFSFDEAKVRRALRPASDFSTNPA